MNATRYRTVIVDGLRLFYREAGPPDAPAVLLLPPDVVADLTRNFLDATTNAVTKPG
jgi:hypothetical protein